MFNIIFEESLSPAWFVNEQGLCHLFSRFQYEVVRIHHFHILTSVEHLGLSPVPVTVSKRIVTFLVGDPELNLHLPLLLGGGSTQSTPQSTINIKKKIDPNKLDFHNLDLDLIIFSSQSSIVQSCNNKTHTHTKPKKPLETKKKKL